MMLLLQNIMGFDSETAERLVKELRREFSGGKTRGYEWRVSQLKMILKMLVEKEKDILDALHKDMGKPGYEAYASEVVMIKSSCEDAVKNLKKWMKPQKASVPIMAAPGSAKILSDPLGVVLVISSWNYPFLLSLDPVIGAIAAGNSVVLKPSELAPATSSLLASMIHQYLDDSVVKVIEGSVGEATALLEQKWDKIFYTGSTRVGRIIMAAAAKHLTPVTLELGGKSPVVVDSNIDLDVASKRISAGKWGSNCGQACVAADYIITTKSFAPFLVESLRKTITSFYGNNPLGSSDLSRIVNLDHFMRLSKMMDEEKVFDKIVHGGQRDVKRLVIEPTILLDVPLDSMMMNEEIFGPLLPIITVDKIEDSINIISSKPKPLAAYLFTKDNKLEKLFMDQVSSGGMIINDTILHIAVSSLPFGGVGDSGFGAYHGKYSFDTFSHKKPVLRKHFYGELPLRHPPYTEFKWSILKAFVNGNLMKLIPTLISRFSRHNS